MAAAKRPAARRGVDVSIPVPREVKGHAHRGAFRKGYTAARTKKAERTNPYSLKKSPVVRGLHYTWIRGYRAGTTATA